MTTTPPTVSPSLIAQFLKLLYGAVAAGFLIIWRKSNKSTRAFPIDQLGAAATYVLTTAPHDDVYFGVGLQGKTPDDGQRGAAQGVTVLVGLWCDVDMANDGAHKKTNLPATDADVAWILECVPWKFSVIVDSGYGRHAYLLFKEPWILANDEERERAKSVSKRFQAVLINRAGTRGWHLDSTHDLARVLRVAGSLNHKIPDDPRAVRLFDVNDTRVDPREVEQWLNSSEANARGVAAADQKPKKVPTEKKPTKPGQAKGEKPRTTSAMTARESGDDDHETQADFEAIRAGCAWARNVTDHQADASEPEWYGLLSIVVHCKGGDALVHDVSRGHRGYSAEETAIKAEQAKAAAGPRTCTNIADELGGAKFCSTCTFSGHVKSPITIGIRAARRNETRAAGARVEDVLRQVKETKDTTLALVEHVIRDLAVVRERDPFRYLKLREHLKKAKVPLTSVDAGFAALSSSGRRQDVTVGDTLPDAPAPNLVVPNDFAINADGVHHVEYVNGKRTLTPSVRVVVASPA